MSVFGVPMRIFLVFAVSLWATACTSSRPFVDEPIIDRKGVDMSRYYADKAECEVYANEVRTGEKVARGAVGGAVVGGAIVVGVVSGGGVVDGVRLSLRVRVLFVVVHVCDV